uniref:Major capsid protein n=1 Tax=Rhabditophanes sp. KR3021 TaxID=114890 RepID=A0AC35TVD4_9BILA
MSGTKVKTLGPNEAPTAAFATNEYVLFRRPPVANALNFKVVRLTNEEKLPVIGIRSIKIIMSMSYMLNNVAATMSQFYLYVPNIPTNHATINHRTAVSVIGLPSDISNLNFLSIYSHTTKSYPALSPMPVIPVLYTTLNQKNAGFKYEDYPKLYNPPNYNYIDWAIKVKPDVANEHPFYSMYIVFMDNLFTICVDGASNLLRVHEWQDHESDEEVNEELSQTIENVSASENNLNNISDDLLNISIEIDDEKQSEPVENVTTEVADSDILNELFMEESINIDPSLFIQNNHELPMRIHCFAHQLNLLFADLFKLTELNAV